MPSPAEVMRRWFEEVWNQKNETAIDDLMAADGVAHGIAPEPQVGPAAFKPSHRALLDAFPDLHVEILRMVVEGDLVTTHIRTTGSHAGGGLGAPATNRPVKFHGMVIARVRDGRVVEGWNCIDFLTMYQQLGWVGRPVLPAE